MPLPKKKNYSKNEIFKKQYSKYVTILKNIFYNINQPGIVMRFVGNKKNQNNTKGSRQVLQ